MFLTNFREIISAWHQLYHSPQNTKGPPNFANFFIKQIAQAKRLKIPIEDTNGLAVLARIHTTEKMYSGMLTQMTILPKENQPTISFTMFGPRELRVENIPLANVLDILFWPNPVGGVRYLLKEEQRGVELQEEKGAQPCRCQEQRVIP